MNSPLPLAPPDPSTRRILVTTALPYANGDIHLGHLLGYIQADIWARFHKMRRAECWHVFFPSEFKKHPPAQSPARPGPGQSSRCG